MLVDAAPKILPEIPPRLGEYAAEQLTKRGVEIRVGTTLESVEPHAAQLSNGERFDTHTVVWTAGVKANPMLASFGLPLDERGRVKVDEQLRVEGHEHVWALGDCAAVPNLATPGAFDPPTSQHALRQARRLAKNLAGEQKPYRYRMLGQVATLGRYKGIADVPRLPLHRLPRLVHHADVPPLPAAALLAEAARGGRLDDLALLPPRHRRALDARPSQPPRCVTSSPARTGSWPAAT